MRIVITTISLSCSVISDVKGKIPITPQKLTTWELLLFTLSSSSSSEGGAFEKQNTQTSDFWVVPKAAGCVSPGDFLEMQIPATAPISNPRLTESKPLVQSPVISVLISPPAIPGTLKFENHDLVPSFVEASCILSPKSFNFSGRLLNFCFFNWLRKIHLKSSLDCILSASGGKGRIPV